MCVYACACVGVSLLFLHQFDADRNGHITVAEIGEVLKALGESTPGYKIRDMVREVDIDENGTVEFGEFVEVRVIIRTCIYLRVCIVIIMSVFQQC